MYELLTPVVICEASLVLLLLIKIGPLRELVLKCVDQLKIGSGSVTLLGIAGTLVLILLSRFYSIVKMGNKGAKLGAMSAMDQALYKTHMLEFALLGFALFLGLVIERTHHSLTKLIELESTKEEVDMLKKEKLQLKEKEDKSSQEIKLLQAKISTLSEDLKKVKLECVEKEKIVETAECHVASLQKQAADLLLEYDRLLEDNQNLQTQFAGYKS